MGDFEHSDEDTPKFHSGRTHSPPPTSRVATSSYSRYLAATSPDNTETDRDKDRDKEDKARAYQIEEESDSDDEPSHLSLPPPPSSSSSLKKPSSPSFRLPSPPSSSKKPPSMGKKTVSFHPDTIIPREDNLALSITKHHYTKELGYTQYHIQLLYRGVEWTVLKRYRDFASFHQKMLDENSLFQLPLPDLPKKRWFEKQRWLNKFDESYSLHRRNALQEYLRMLARTPVVKYKFKSFSDFLEIPFDQLPPSEFDDEEKAASDTKTTDNPAFLPPDPHNTNRFPTNGLYIEEERESSLSEPKPKVPFRDSILETPLSQQFDDNGEVIPSRP